MATNRVARTLAEVRRVRRKKGKKVISFTAGTGALVKIAIQMRMETNSPDLVWNREFHGLKPIEPMLDWLEKNRSEFYGRLQNSRGEQYPPRTRSEMLNLLYHRGHKGFIDCTKEKEPGGRPRISPEHYTLSKRLLPLVEEAVELFGPVLGIGRTRTK